MTADICGLPSSRRVNKSYSLPVTGFKIVFADTQSNKHIFPGFCCRSFVASRLPHADESDQTCARIIGPSSSATSIQPLEIAMLLYGDHSSAQNDVRIMNQPRWRAWHVLCACEGEQLYIQGYHRETWGAGFPCHGVKLQECGGSPCPIGGENQLDTELCLQLIKGVHRGKHCLSWEAERRGLWVHGTRQSGAICPDGLRICSKAESMCEKWT